MNHLVVVRELVSMCGLLGGQPLQFRTLLTGCQYLPLYRLAERHARPGMSVLDWGAGNGHFSYFLLRLGLEVTAFNFQSHKCALADLLHARFGARFRISYGPDDEPTRLPFADGSFDLAFSIGVLEHVRETGGSELGSLAELKRVLKPGGLLACGMLPKKYSWIEFLARHVPGRRHRHLYRYTGRDLGDLLSRSGFQLIELGTHGFLPRNSLNRPALGRLTGRNRSPQTVQSDRPPAVPQPARDRAELHVLCTERDAIRFGRGRSCRRPGRCADACRRQRRPHVLRKTTRSCR